MLERLIGRGGFGNITQIGAQWPYVAVKKIHVNQEIGKEFYERELKNLEKLQRLRHPNIVEFHGKNEVLDDGNTYFMIYMEYYERQSLRHVMNDPSIIYRFKTILGWSEQLASSLLCLKNNQILHRDIKPENVLVTDNFILKLCDFGLGKDLSLGKSMSFVGTPRYMSPEASGVLGEIEFNHKSDLWAFGLIMWEMVERRLVYSPNYEATNQTFHIAGLIGDLSHSRYVLPPANCETRLRNLISECTQFRNGCRPEIDEVLARLEKMNQACNQGEFEPRIQPDQAQIMRPSDCLHISPEFVEPSRFERLSLVRSSKRIYTKCSKAVKTIVFRNNFEESVEDEQEEMVKTPNTKNLLVKLKILAHQGGVLAEVENQLDKCTKFPNDSVFLVDELPALHPMIDDDLLKCFKEAKVSSNLMRNIKKLLEKYGQYLQQELESFMRGVVVAVKCYRKGTVNSTILMENLEKMYQIIADCSRNVFYNQWLDVILYVNGTKRFYLLSRKRRSFINTNFNEKTILDGDFASKALLGHQVFKEQRTNEIFSPFLIKGFHIEDLFMELRSRAMRRVSQSSDLSQVTQILHEFTLRERAFPNFNNDRESTRFENFIGFESFCQAFEQEFRLRINPTMFGIQAPNRIKRIENCLAELSQVGAFPSLIRLNSLKLSEGDSQCLNELIEWRNDEEKVQSLVDLDLIVCRGDVRTKILYDNWVPVYWLGKELQKVIGSLRESNPLNSFRPKKNNANSKKK